MRPDVRVVGCGARITEVIRGCKDGRRSANALAINPRPGRPNDVARSILVALNKKPGGGLGYRATDCEDDALNWLEAHVWSDLIVLSADELEASQIAWTIAAVAPQVKRTWLVGLEEQAIQRRLPQGWEGVDMARPMEVGRLLANLRRPVRSRPISDVPENLRFSDPVLFRELCWRLLTEESFYWADSILKQSARRAAAYVKSYGHGRLPIEPVWRDLVNAETDEISFLRLRGCQIGLLHHGVVLLEDRAGPLGEPERAEPYEPLHQITDPEATAMAALFMVDPAHAMRVSYFTITPKSPATLEIQGVGQWAIPGPARPLLRPQLAQLRRERRGAPGCRFFPDRDWEPRMGLNRGAAFENRIRHRVDGMRSHEESFRHAGFRMLDVRTLDSSAADLESPARRQIATAELLVEIISTRDDLVVGGLDSQDGALGRRLIETGHLERRAGRLGLTEAAAWGLYLEHELDLPCSTYRRREVAWPVETALPTAS